MNQFGLQLLQPGFGLLALAQITDESREIAIRARFHLADRQLHRERRAILALADDHTADPDDPPLPCCQIALYIAVMLLPIRRRHEHAHVLADHMFRTVAEQPYG